MTPFEHGGDRAAFAKICGCDITEVIDFSSNINFVTPRIDIDFNRLDIAPYPDYDALYDALCVRYGTQRSQTALFNGASSAIYALLGSLRRTVNGCTLYTPAYLEYKRAALHFGMHIDFIDRFKQIEAPSAPHSLVIFVNPATPDGKGYEIEPFLKQWHQNGCSILIDESFLDFTDIPSATRYLADYPNLYILKSMTKYYGAAGIRIGMLIASKEAIASLQAGRTMRMMRCL